MAEIRSRLAHLALCGDVAAGDPLEFDDELDRAVRAFQQERGITVDGIVGPHTFRRLEEARWQLGDRVLSYVPGHLMAGDDVTELQRRLNTLGFAAGRADGLFGVQTDAALREFQKGVGVTADGTCGPDTFRAFDRLVRTISGGNAASLREHVTLSELQTGVADKVVVLDPGDTVDADLCHAIAVRVEGRLAALGTQVLLTRPAQRDPATGFPDDPARAAVRQRDRGRPRGVAARRPGREPAAQRPGHLLLRRSPRRHPLDRAAGSWRSACRRSWHARTDLLDCRTHPRTWDLLRMTRMPAVRVELGYLSNEADARRLTSAAFQDAVAEGIAAAVTAFCAPR